MSTKINSRSPYFLTFTAPTQSLGTFVCTGNKFMANPDGFEVDAYGVIKEPNLQNGIITARSATAFPENTTASPISRSVTYTIAIPDGHDNAGTITCVVTTTQPIKGVATGGTNCPTISSAITDITGLNGTQTINLATKFAAGSVAISNYNVTIIGSLLITATVSGATLTITGTSPCQSATVYVTAQNATDACEVVDTFTVATVCTKALHCTTDDSSNTAVGLSTSTFNADGSFNWGSPSVSGIEVSAVVYNLTSHGDPYGATGGTALAPTVAANGTGSTRTVYLQITWVIPSGFTNSGTLACTYNITQASTSVKSFNCAFLSNKRVLSDGTVTIPEVSEGGTYHSTTLTGGVFKYPENNTASDINRSVIYNITIASGYQVTIDATTYTAGQQAPCSNTIAQPPQPSYFACGTTSFYITNKQLPFSTSIRLCDMSVGYTFDVSTLLSSTGSAGTVAGHVGETLCQGGNRINGHDQWFGAELITGTVIGSGNQGVFNMIQIDGQGKIIAHKTVSCGTTNYYQIP